MKKELAMMSAMVALVAGMTSCCCKPCNQGPQVTPPVRVEPTKGATVRTAPVKKTTVRTQPAVRTQPTVRKQPAVRTQPVRQPAACPQVVVQQVPVYVQPVVPTLPVNPHAVIDMHKNYNNAGVPYNAENMGGWYGCGYSNGYAPVCPPCHRGVYHR